MINLPAREPVITETSILKQCLTALNRLHGVRAARNNTGKSPCACQPCRAKLCRVCQSRLDRPITFGLGLGGTDIVGTIAIKGPGGVLPCWFGLEIKVPGRENRNSAHVKTQRAWREAAARRGVLTAVVTSHEEAVAHVVSMQAVYEYRLAGHET